MLTEAGSEKELRPVERMGETDTKAANAKDAQEAAILHHQKLAKKKALRIYKQGDLVSAYCTVAKKWFDDATVLEVFSEDEVREGGPQGSCIIVAGAVKVGFNGGEQRRIYNPDELTDNIKKRVTHASDEEEAVGPKKKAAPKKEKPKQPSGQKGNYCRKSNHALRSGRPPPGCVSQACYGHWELKARCKGGFFDPALIEGQNQWSCDQCDYHVCEKCYAYQYPEDFQAFRAQEALRDQVKRRKQELEAEKDRRFEKMIVQEELKKAEQEQARFCTAEEALKETAPTMMKRLSGGMKRRLSGFGTLPTLPPQTHTQVPEIFITQASSTPGAYQARTLQFRDARDTEIRLQIVGTQGSRIDLYIDNQLAKENIPTFLIDHNAGTWNCRGLGGMFKRHENTEDIKKRVDYLFRQAAQPLPIILGNTMGSTAHLSPSTAGSARSDRSRRRHHKHDSMDSKSDTSTRISSRRSSGSAVSVSPRGGWEHGHPRRPSDRE